MHQEAFAGMFIDQFEKPCAVVIMNSRADKVAAPYMVGPLIPDEDDGRAPSDRIFM